MNARETIERVVYQSCMLLDDKNFRGYLDLCDPDFRYAITAHSPEIRKDMIWLEHDKKGMEQLFANLPRHNSDHSPLTRHATLYTLDDIDDTGRAVRAVSALQVYRTSIDGGTTELFAVGKYVDTLRISLDSGTARLRSRTVKLDTRMLGIGSHIPF